MRPSLNAHTAPVFYVGDVNSTPLRPLFIEVPLHKSKYFRDAFVRFLNDFLHEALACIDKDFHLKKRKNKKERKKIARLSVAMRYITSQMHILKICKKV